MSYVWVQLYINDKPRGFSFEIESPRNNCSALAEAVKAKLKNQLNHVDPNELKVYTTIEGSSGLTLLRPGDRVPTGTSDNNPLIVEAPAPPQQQQIPTDKINQICDYIMKQRSEEGTVQISNPGKTRYDKTVNKVGVRLDAAVWNDKPTGLEELASSMVSHTWLPGKEDSEENRKAYMRYLNDRQKITLPVRGKLFEGSGEGDLLSLDMEEFQVKMKGNIDVVLAADHHQAVGTTRMNMWAGIELKKKENTKHGDIQRQVILQHLSASFLNEDKGIVTIMTDLCDRWHFYWFSKQASALVRYEASKGEANYLIRHLMDDPDSAEATTMPNEFLNRASWNQMFSSKQEEIGTQNRNNDEENDSVDEDGKTQGESVVYKTEHSSERSGEPKNTAHAGSSESDNAKQVARLDMDFMDEEEEREETFKQVIKYSLPRMMYFPQRCEEENQDSRGPPAHVFIS